VKFEEVPSKAGSGALDIKTCIDINGQEFMPGASWQIESQREEAVDCPDSGSQMQMYSLIQSYFCADGVVQDAGQSMTAVPPMAACPPPELSARANPPLPPMNTTTQLLVRSANVKSVAFKCTASGTQDVVKEGDLPVGDTSVALVASRDLVCNVSAMTSTNMILEQRVDIPVDCGNKLKVGGRCVDFDCQIVQTLSVVPGQTLEVPARSEQGVCFRVKLMNAIANSSSTLTQELDDEVVSRNHNGGEASKTRHPYVLGRSLLSFKTLGLRTIKLAGPQGASSPIRVDNFVLSGIYPTADQSPGVSSYRAYGTKDSTIPNTTYIFFRDRELDLVGFESGGTSTIAPLDITTQVLPGTAYILDVRALDCGGSRELSEIYLLFQ